MNCDICGSPLGVRNKTGVCSPGSKNVKPECSSEWLRRRYSRVGEVQRAKAAVRYQEDPAVRFSKNFAWRYNITQEQYLQMIADQDGECASCGRGTETFHVDHDHACCPERARSCGKCIRGLVCGGCNLAIGHAGDDPDRLIAMAAYLIRHSASERV